MEQIVVTAGLCAAPRHFKSAKRVAADDRAGDRSVDIQIANEELRTYLRDISRASGIESSC